MGTFSTWTFLLFISLSGAYGLSFFPDNVVVAKKNDANSVTLTCGMKSDGAVVWKLEKDGDIDEVELGDNVQQHGQDLKVSDVDMPIVGEYSCWSGEKKISSTYLLLDPEEKNLDSLSCWANSYNCNFSCKWTNAEYTAVHLGVGPECSGGEKSCSWFAPGKTGTLPGGGGFQFELSHFFSPYTEESTMLEVTAEAINSYSFVRMTKRFYLRDIVQPDSPQIIACQEVGQELNVSIDPASSWSTPPSFFSLEHEIEYEYKDDGKTERSSSSLIPKGISRLRARSRDSVVRSTWSEWTDWKNVKTGKKNLCKCKTPPENYCCPQLSSEDADHCRTGKQKKKRKSKQN